MTQTLEAFRCEARGPVFWIFLNNPKKRNAIGTAFMRELPMAFAEAQANPAIRAVVLAGEGPAFCSGLNLMEMAMSIPALMSGSPSAKQREELLGYIQETQKIAALPESCPLPVIAAIHGSCIGGGLDLAAACDIRLAARDALLSLREAAVAMVADWGSLERIAAICGQGVVRELAYTACDLPAERALQLHLVNELFEDKEALWAGAQALGERIARNSPLAVRASKAALNFGRGRTVEEGLAFSAMTQSRLLPNGDLLEAVAAFAERRPPVFKGE